MDKNYYKTKLKDALVKAAIANKAVKDFVALVDRQGSLIGLITVRIMELTPVSPSDAKTYINYETGKFNGGRGMPHCIDPKLKKLFAEHESIVTRQKTLFNFQTVEEGVNIANNLVSKAKNIIIEIKKVFDDNTAKEICSSAKTEAIRETGIQF